MSPAAILGIDTATSATAVALVDAGGAGIERRVGEVDGRPAHTGQLLSLVEEVLTASGASWDDVGRIAVGVGPGGFTGLRIGLATVRALAQARDIEVVGVGSLEALAGGLADVATAIDARRGEVYGAAWRNGDAYLRPRAEPPEVFAARLDAGTAVLGDGAVRYRSVFEAAGLIVAPDDDPAHGISALACCALGRTATPVSLDALMPDYCREADARRPVSA